jgi:hypothetical protein
VSGCHGGHRRAMVAIVFGTEGEPVAVLCDAATDPPQGQRWFTVVLNDSPGPNGPSEAPGCVGCLIDEHPRLGRGLDVAFEHRGARWVDEGSAGAGAVGRLTEGGCRRPARRFSVARQALRSSVGGAHLGGTSAVRDTTPLALDARNTRARASQHGRRSGSALCARPP